MPLGPNGKPLSPIASNNDKAEQARMRSNMVVLNGGGVAQDTQAAGNANTALNRGDPNKAFTANVLAASAAEKVTATRLNNLSITIAQGKNHRIHIGNGNQY